MTGRLRSWHQVQTYKERTRKLRCGTKYPHSHTKTACVYVCELDRVRPALYAPQQLGAMGQFVNSICTYLLTFKYEILETKFTYMRYSTLSYPFRTKLLCGFWNWVHQWRTGRAGPGYLYYYKWQEHADKICIQ